MLSPPAPQPPLRADGFHRLAKALKEGRTHLPAKRFLADPDPIRTVDMPDYILETYFPKGAD